MTTATRIALTQITIQVFQSFEESLSGVNAAL
jgi:hypothetical protein